MCCDESKSVDREAPYEVAPHIVGWRAWYANGQVYDSVSSGWESLPDDGVLVIKLYFNTEYVPGKRYSRAMMGSDWYFRAAGSEDFVYGSCSEKEFESLHDRYKNAVSKRGIWVEEQKMYRVADAAGKSDRWP